MIRIIFINSLTEQIVVNAYRGENLLEVAKRNNVEGIEGICGGKCSCASCQVIIPDQEKFNIKEITEYEEETLQYSFNRQKDSRLACQIHINEEMNNIIVYIPDRQY